MEGGDSKFAKFTSIFKGILRACSQSVWQQARTCCWCYWIQKKMHFFHKLTIFWSARNRRKDSFYFHILHHLSPVSLADATAVAFVLLHSCRFNFQCYAQHEPAPIQKSAQKWQLWPFTTSCTKDYEGHSLMQTSLSELPNMTEFDRPWVTLCSWCGINAAVTFRDFLRERLQRAFTHANQLLWTAQYDWVWSSLGDPVQLTWH